MPPLNFCFNVFQQNNLTVSSLAAATINSFKNAFYRKTTGLKGHTNMGRRFFTALTEGSAKGKDISWLCKDIKCSAVQNKWKKMHLICIGKCCGWLLASLCERVWCFNCVQLCDCGGTEWDGCENITRSFTANEIFIMTNLCTRIWTSVPKHRRWYFAPLKVELKVYKIKRACRRTLGTRASKQLQLSCHLSFECGDTLNWCINICRLLFAPLRL